MSLVTPQLSLTAELAATATQLSQQQKDRIRDEALERLRVVDPILPHVLEVRVSGVLGLLLHLPWSGPSPAGPCGCVRLRLWLNARTFSG